MELEEVKGQVLERTRPSEEEEQENRELFSRIQDFVEDEFGREAELVGSTAKGTFMSGDKDLDIFVFFDTSVSADELEEEGLEIGEAVFDEFDGGYDVEYAEHPYTKGGIEDYEVEIVPAYRVDSGEDIKSSVDRTPFHRRWINENLSREEKEDVIVLKAFLRGRELYGSTLKIQGFSGYLCELLVAEYGSFEQVLEAAVEWDRDQVIDPADHHDSLPNHLRKKFSDEDLVVIDPVDPERNVASVLSNENYARFIHSAWRFLEEPDMEFFFPPDREADREMMEANADERGDFLIVEFPTPDLMDDILYPQMRSLLSRLETLLRGDKFRVFHSGFHVGDEATRIAFELFSRELPSARKHRGPQVFHNTEHLENFSSKYDDVWVEGERLVTIVEREHPDARQLLDDFLAGDLREEGVPGNLVPSVEEAEITGLEFDGEDWRKFLRDEFHLEVEP